MTIVITGTDRCDFAYYLGRTLYEVSPRTIVIDNSDSHQLFNCVFALDKQETAGVFSVKRSEITYLRDIDYSPEFFEAFDFVVIYEGKYPDYEELERVDYVLAMPNYEPDSIERAKDLPENAEYIMRDHAGKIADKALPSLLDVDRSRIIGSISYDDRDYERYLELIYNGRQKPIGLSEEMQEALIYTIAKVTDGNEKNAKKILKKAGR